MEVIETKPDLTIKPYMSTVSAISFVSTQSRNRQQYKIIGHNLPPNPKPKSNPNLKKLKPYKCSQCFSSTKQLSKYFTTSAGLKRHLLQFHTPHPAPPRPPRFKCELCFKSCYTACDLRKHRQTHYKTNNQEETIIRCDQCPRTFADERFLQDHLFTKHNQKTEGVNYLQCEFCSHEFLNRSNYERHVIDEHVVDKEFECLVCSKRFIDQTILDKHMTGHSREHKFFCQVCSKGYFRCRHLSDHLQRKHGQSLCNKCFGLFSNKYEFDQHFEYKTGLELKCRMCSDTFRSVCLLHIHTNSHSKEMKEHPMNETTIVVNNTTNTNCAKFTQEQPAFPCDLCLRTFSRESHFRIHRTQFHPEAAWTCKFKTCSKSFKQYFNLKRHQVRHYPGRKFKCAIFPQNLALPKCMRKHVASKHGGWRPFKCPFNTCKAFFFNYSAVHRHLMCHQTTQNLFKCEKCLELKIFKTRSKLEEHLRRHAKVKKIRNSLTPKSLNDPVIICSSNKCSFQTLSEKEVALHFKERHGLPKVVLALAKC